MQSRLPPLKAVRVFDACARHLNFTRAAEELSVSHSAVSKQIALLEDFVGELLFERSGGGVALTEEGRRLRDMVAPAFSQLESAFVEHRRQQPGTSTLRVATVASLAAYVLMPAYSALSEALPQLDLEISTSDRTLDLSREAVDVAIRFGRGGWPGLNVVELAPGKLTAVAHPDRTTTFRSMPRLQAFATDEWSNVEPSLRPSGPIIHCEHFAVAIETVRAKQGIGLLPHTLVKRLLDDGQLIRLPIDDVDCPDTFYIASHPTSRRQGDIARFVAALQELL